MRRLSLEKLSKNIADKEGGMRQDIPVKREEKGRHIIKLSSLLSGQASSQLCFGPNMHSDRRLSLHHLLILSQPNLLRVTGQSETNVRFFKKWGHRFWGGGGGGGGDLLSHMIVARV
jgi:hypothetical protein